MMHYRFQEGDHVKARETMFGVPAGTLGIITRRYAMLWGLYEVQFEQHPTTRVVWEEDLSVDGIVGLHNREMESTR
jgi:hypothetical protein